jgi:16S rRNA (cytidine1402-2'-O)-methyltransferase
MMARADVSRQNGRTILVEGQTVAVAALAPGLHVVATPIGNLGDITLRALHTLGAADLILCEDTRVTAKLTNHYGIRAPLRPYHDHNAARVRPAVIAALERGEAVALVSDAGTPLVSDPGYRLVAAAVEAGVAVHAVPGPSAALAALAVSGLPSDRFLFAGFLPQKAGQRDRALAELADAPASLIVYESPRRLAATLAAMAAILGDRRAVVARELTKLHEETRRGTLQVLADAYAGEGAPRGEVVIVVAPPLPPEEPHTDEIDALLRGELEKSSVKEAAAAIARKTGLPRRMLYARAVELNVNIDDRDD